MSQNLLDWTEYQARKEGLGSTQKLKTLKEGEPMKVEEHPASTTIIERLYAVLGKRRG
jgi:hypothetical protein